MKLAKQTKKRQILYAFPHNVQLKKAQSEHALAITRAGRDKGRQREVQ